MTEKGTNKAYLLEVNRGPGFTYDNKLSPELDELTEYMANNISNKNVEFVDKKIKVDIAYDRAAGLDFPKTLDNLSVVDSKEFKILAWDKWLAYKEVGEFMPKTYLISDNL